MPTLPPGAAPVRDLVANGEFTWLIERYARGEIVKWARIPDDIPASAMAERTEGIRIGAKSVLAIPLGSGAAHFVLALVSVRSYREWPDSLVRRLQLIGEIFTSVLTRRRTERSLSNSEARLRAILQAFPDLIFVMSAEGVYLECHAPFQGDLFVPAERFLGRTIEEVFSA